MSSNRSGKCHSDLYKDIKIHISEHMKRHARISTNTVCEGMSKQAGNDRVTATS